MKKQNQHPTRADFRAAAFHDKTMNELHDELQNAIPKKYSAAAINDIVTALGDFPINRELIVNAGVYGHVDMLDALTRKIPASTAQDYYDRALIGIAINHFVPESQYLAAATLLVSRGANPVAYEGRAILLAHSYLDKKSIVSYLEHAEDQIHAAPKQKPKI